jgi:flagellar protein FliS
MNTGGQDAYLRDAVLTAPPEQLQLMLYDGAIRFVTQAREAVSAKDIEGSHRLLMRAQTVVLEMLKGLNQEIAPALADQMSRLYNFIYRKLVEANINKDLGALDDALGILRYQRETWVMLIDRLRQEATGPAPSPNTSRGDSRAEGAGLCLEG